MWMLLFCAWGAKSGGCVTPVTLPSKRACEFVMRHQTAVAKERDREWPGNETLITTRCIGVKP
jgi:hypothetical protein